MEVFINEVAALGEDTSSKKVELGRAPITMEERVDSLEQQNLLLTESMDSLYQIVKDIGNHTANQKRIDDEIDMSKDKKKQQPPIGTALRGIAKGIPYWCVRKPDGKYYIGLNVCDTLSAAAQSLVGTRYNGREFWKFASGKYEGQSVNEVYSA